MHQTFTRDIIHLNVGGSRFSTSRQTLCSIHDSFFSSLLSGRIPTCRDETGALFIDRDPDLFKKILSFLRTKELDLNGVDVSALRHEAEFYGIVPLVKRLVLCEDLDRSLCGDVLFTGFIGAPTPSLVSKGSHRHINTNLHESIGSGLGLITSLAKPGNVLRLSNNLASSSSVNTSGKINNLTAATLVQSVISNNNGGNCAEFDLLINAKHSHSRKSSNDNTAAFNCLHSVAPAFSKTHSRNQSLDLKQVKTDLGEVFI